MRVMVVRTQFPEASRPGSLKAPEVPDILQHPQQEGNKNHTEPTLLNGKASSGSMGVYKTRHHLSGLALTQHLLPTPNTKAAPALHSSCIFGGHSVQLIDHFPAAKFSS